MVTSVLLIAERHSHWERWAQTWCNRQRQLIVLIQSSVESQSGFTVRIEASIDRLTAVHCRLGLVLLMPADNASAATCVGRAQMLDQLRLKLAGRSTATAVRLIVEHDWKVAQCITPKP